jgi:hypothetical protein
MVNFLRGYHYNDYSATTEWTNYWDQAPAGAAGGATFGAA